MKKKMILLILFLAGMLCLSACSNGNTTEDSKTSDTTEQEAQKDSEKKEQEQEQEDTIFEQEEPKTEKEDTTVQTPETKPVNITIYYSNDDATGFASEEVQIPSLTPEEVLKALVDKGAMAADVRILSFETTTAEGKATIELDFSSEFSSYVFSMGSTGEYYVMGSVCNTFLDAYDCEQIKITVEGQVLSTGHAEYPGYMSKFVE